MKIMHSGLGCLAACGIWFLSAGYGHAGVSPVAQLRTGSSGHLSEGVPQRLDDPVKGYNKQEKTEVSGKFEVFRAGENSILISVGKQYQAIFLNRSTKLTRGDKAIRASDLQKGEVLKAKVEKSQGKMTATEIVVGGK